MRPLGRRLLATTASVVMAAGAAGAGIGYAAAGPDHAALPPADVGYGGAPSYLPPGPRTDFMETGSVQRPALSSEGDAIRVTLPRGGRVTAVVSGPEAPGEGLPFQAEADTATWTVTLSHATTDVPIRLSQFSVFDSVGKTYRPLLVPDTKSPPATLRPGHTASFQMRVVMHTGEGTVRWAPQRDDLLAVWDYTLEND